MLYIQLHQGELSHPVSTLEDYFRRGGVTIIQAAFAHSYFIHPVSVGEKTPYFPNGQGSAGRIIREQSRDRKQSGLETDERSSSTTTNMPSWHGGDTRATGWPGEPGTRSATSGDIHGIRTLSRPGGTYATCPSGLEC